MSDTQKKEEELKQQQLSQIKNVLKDIFEKLAKENKLIYSQKEKDDAINFLAPALQKAFKTIPSYKSMSNAFKDTLEQMLVTQVALNTDEKLKLHHINVFDFLIMPQHKLENSLIPELKRSFDQIIQSLDKKLADERKNERSENIPSISPELKLGFGLADKFRHKRDELEELENNLEKTNTSAIKSPSPKPSSKNDFDELSGLLEAYGHEIVLEKDIKKDQTIEGSIDTDTEKKIDEGLVEGDSIINTPTELKEEAKKNIAEEEEIAAERRAEENAEAEEEHTYRSPGIRSPLSTRPEPK